MRVVAASDYAGYELKTLLVRLVEQLGHTVSDLGTHGTAPVDYPDSAAAVGRAVRRRRSGCVSAVSSPRVQAWRPRGFYSQAMGRRGMVEIQNQKSLVGSTESA